MERDLRFAWEEMPQQLLDEQAQKVRESLHAALIDWAQQAGEGADYTDNLPVQCLHPVGHWYEVPNLLRNGTLLRLLAERPRLNYLMVHNIDTAGRGRRRRRCWATHRKRRGADHRSDRAPHLKTAAAAWPAWTAACAWWKAWRCPTRKSNRASPITTAPPTGSISIACWRSSA